MNIAVDYGNTIAKVGIFSAGRLGHKHSFSSPSALESFLTSSPADHIIVSSVSFPAQEVLSWSKASGKRISLSHELPLPIKVLYKTPHTLGVDRIAAVCGALEVCPGQDCLVIDAGTCITYEFLDARKNYHGGGISPGINMRFGAMHNFTERLPLAIPFPEVPLIGDSTEHCLQSGVMHGVRAEIEGIIQKYREQFPQLRIILCGGDAWYFENLVSQHILLIPDLVLIGLNSILQHA